MICKVYVKKERKKRKDRKKKKDRRERIDARIVEKEDWWGWTSWIGCAIHDLLPRGCARGYVPRYIYSCPVPRAADSISTLEYFERIHTGIFSRHDRLLSRPVSMHCEYNLFCYKKKKNSKEFRIMRLVLSWLIIIIILIKVVIIWEKTYLKLFSTRSCINSDYFEKLKADIRFKSIHSFTSFIYFVRIHEENIIFNLRLYNFDNWNVSIT